MASNKLSLLALFFIPLLIFAEQQGSETRLAEARQCRIERLSASRPSRRIESEGGITELWDELQDEFQCTGIGAMRNIIRRNSLSLPSYSPAPRLVYIERGEGLIGIVFPGCPETYQSRGQSAHAGSGSKGDDRLSDKHQKVHRIRKGDIVALPPGVAHWCYNDGNEELVAMSVADLNSQSNQLDQRFRSMYLAGVQFREASSGGQRPQEQEREQPFGESILRGFDPNLIADSLNIPVDLARKLQRGDQRGLIVKVQREGMSLIQPEEEGEERNQIPSRDGIEEEDYCAMSIRHNVDNTREADIFTRQGGRLNIVDRFKLPILKQLDMSVERGSIFPNAMFVPHWSVTGHSILYVLRGEGQFQVSDNSGRLVFNGRVKEGDLIPIPQNFVSMKKAGSNGIEWIVFKTTSQPSSEAVVGSSSVFKGMPLQVVANSYRISNREAQDLKYSRAEHVFIVPPPTSRSTTS